MWERILVIVRKELLQTVRDMRRRTLLFGPPLLQLIVFGYAVNMDVRNARLAWLDLDNTPESRELRASFESSRYFQVVETPSRIGEARNLLDQGQIQAIVQILPRFGRDVRRGTTAAVQILVDGTNSNTAAIISNYASQIVASYASAMLAGCGYGLLIVTTAASAIEIRNRAVHPQTALSYAMLLAVLTLISWFAARVAGFEHGWWLPLAVSAIGEPSLAESAQRAVSKTAAALCATVPLLALLDSVTNPVMRAAVVLLLAMLLFTAGRRRPALQTFLLTPIVVLFASHQPAYSDGVQYLRATLVACAVVFTFSVLSKWVLWTLRPDAGRVAV